METLSCIAVLYREGSPFAEIMQLIKMRPEVLERQFPQQLPYSLLTREKEVNMYGKETGHMTVLHMSLFFNRPEEETLEILSITPDTALDLCWGIGNTALHLAAAKGLTRVVSTLLDRGASSDVINEDQTSVLALAANDEIREMISKAMATAMDRTPGYLRALMESPVFRSKSLAVTDLLADIIRKHGGSVAASSSPARTISSVQASQAANASPVSIERTRVHVAPSPVHAASSAAMTRVETPVKAASSPAVAAQASSGGPRRATFLRDSIAHYEKSVMNEIYGGSPQSNKPFRMLFSLKECRHNLKHGAKVRASVTIGKRTITSMDVRVGDGPIRFNFECCFPVDGENQKNVMFMLTQLKEKGVSLNALLGRSTDSSSEMKEIKIADTMLDWATVSATPNAIGKKILNWFSSSDKHPFKGNMDIEWYYHTDKDAPKIPQSFADVSELGRLRAQRDRVLAQPFVTARVFYVESPGSRLVERFLEARNGQLILKGVISGDEKEIIDLTGFTGITYPSRDEFALTNAIAVNTQTHTWYFRTTTKADRDEVVEGIQKMMRVVQSAYLQGCAPQSPSRPPSSLRNKVQF